MQASVMPGLIRQSKRLALRRPVVALCFSVSVRRAHGAATQLPQGSHVKDIRNIGIIAHVDAVSCVRAAWLRLSEI